MQGCKQIVVYAADTSKWTVMEVIFNINCYKAHHHFVQIENLASKLHITN